MSFTERRRRLRALLGGARCIYPGSVYDALSARIAEDLGFEAGMFAGSVASLAVLGAPDLVVLTLSEFAEQMSELKRLTRENYESRVKTNGAASKTPGDYDSDRLRQMMSPVNGDQA